MARTVTIRRSLLVNLVTVIVLLCLGIMAVTFTGARRAVRALSGVLIGRTIDQSEARLEQFFAPVVGGLQVARSWGEEGLLDLEKPGTLNRLLVPLMRQYPQISSLMVADGRGWEHMVLRVGSRWRVRQTRRDDWGDRTRWLEWTDESPQPVESWQDLPYDPRVRPWYQGAVGTRTEMPAAGTEPDRLIHWTEPYIFYTTKDPGITASLAYQTGDGDTLDHVIGFDVLLNDISSFTIGLRPSANGLAFVMTERGQVIGLPRDDRFTRAEARHEAMLKQPTELDVPSVADGSRAYFRAPEASRGAYRFASGGQSWWGGARLFPLGSQRRLLIAVGIPEADLLGNLRQLRVWILLVTAVVLFAAIWRVVALSEKYSRPVEALVRQSERISRGDLERVEVIESDVAEVRQLTEAHESMRRGLQSLMKLERDLQLARQIQQSALPNRLPALRGFSIDAWSEPADATGGDTFDVVGFQSAPGGMPLILSAERADRAVLLLADATGHGIGPALSVTQVRSMLRMAVRTRQDLGQIVHHLNEQLCADLPEGRFITAWLGELNATDRTLAGFSAGQAPILHYDPGRRACDVLAADTLPLGVIRNLDVTVSDPFLMRSGSIVAVISDGVFEAMDAEGRQFGTDRVVEVILAHRREPAGRILKAMREAVAAFAGSVASKDDRTAIIIKGT